MAIKLKLLLQKLHLLLALKAALFGAALWFAYTNGFTLTPLLIFFGTALFLYSRHLFQTLKYGLSLTLFLATALLFMQRLPGAYAWLGLLYFSIGWLLLLGVKEVEFVYRDRAYVLFLLSVLYADLLLFFITILAPLFIVRLLAFFIVAAFLFGQFLKFRRPITNTALAFVFVQVMWGVSLLPIGFLQMANVSFIVAIALLDFTLLHFKNALRREAVIKKAALYAALILVIFLTSQWTLTR